MTGAAGDIGAIGRNLTTMRGLDVMQTLPTFVYLIPAIAFFSIGR